MKKRIVALLAGLLLCGASSAMANVILDSWQMDLSAYGGGTYTNIDRLTIDGNGQVFQTLPLALGASFTETAVLGVVKGIHEPGNSISNQFNINLGPSNQFLYFQASGLQGKVTGFDATGFTYSFTPGVGSIELILDNDGTAGTADDNVLATFSVVAPSGGHDNGNLGGAGETGTTNLTARFDSVVAGLFHTSTNLDFASLSGLTLGLVNTNNLITGVTPTAGGVNLEVASSGQVNMAVVPEPSTMLLLGAGFMGLAIFKKRKASV
ncbi:PEP-CTERM sorting domain-containing protein [Geomesophilobacter sediminis]|uniref:PEP-CTERM sorting domain-containing protein n=1 Tax=Geomesophilobacter sediminis TaxID=2798584 RepID=A0A8J7IM33_9BACT|nr:PEP-CTERM sorting domain-containing protein [Geomesophilobacter sediminis]MBJ6723663.1 PEP-CTERM sorting domain-containing protein [Geomesophilobacter sediminis]